MSTLEKNSKEYDYILSQIEKHGEYYEALIITAIDETKGDIRKSIKLADSAISSEKSRFKKQFKEGGDSISSSDKSLAAHQVGEILTKQYKNIPRNFSPEYMIEKWISSKTFKLVKDVPIWILRPYKYVEPDDKSYSTGPLILDADKNDYPLRNGSFGSNPEFLIQDGKHRYYFALRSGKKTYDCFVGDKIYDDLNEYIKDFSPKRSKFIMAVNAYYRDTTTENAKKVIEAGNNCDLTKKQLNMFFTKYEQGIKFNFDFGEFEEEEWKA